MNTKNILTILVCILLFVVVMKSFYIKVEERKVKELKDSISILNDSTKKIQSILQIQRIYPTSHK